MLFLFFALGSVLSFVVNGSAECATGVGACDGEINNLLQVKEHTHISQDKFDDTDDPLHFRVIPVNLKRRSYFKLRPRKTVLSFAGGGMRVMAGVRGQLRALSDMGLLKKAHQVIGASGGTWALVIFGFAPNPPEELLGDSLADDLSSLTLTEIATPRGKILERAAADLTPYVAIAANPGLAIPPYKLLEVALGGSLLCPFGLNGQIPPFGVVVPGLCGSPISKNQVFTNREGRLRWIQQRNPSLDEATDGLVQNGNLPNIVLHATLLSPVGYKPNSRLVAARFSGDYSGVPYYANQQTVDFEPQDGSGLPPLNNIVVGGGVVENFAFMSTEVPSDQQQQAGRRLGMVEADLEDPPGIISLQEAMGISSAVLGMAGVTSPDFIINTFLKPLASINNYTDRFLEDQYLFLYRRNYWPVAGKAVENALNGNIDERPYYIGDGFSVESSTVLEALRGGAECVVAFANNGFPIDQIVDIDFCDVPPPILANPLLLLQTPLGLQQVFYDYFGVAAPNFILQGGFDYSNNHVFETSEIFDLFCDAQTLRAAGDATVVDRELVTKKNDHWGIEAGRHVHVVFVWTEKATKWEAALPQETQDAINNADFDSPNTAGFPYLGTFVPRPDESDLAALLPEQANLYSSLTEWALKQNQDKLEKCMAKNALPVGDSGDDIADDTTDDIADR